MRYLKQYTLLAIIVIVSFAACKKSDSAPANAPIITTAVDTMAATVNGSQWIAFNHSFGSLVGGGIGYMEITGTDSTGNKSITITINDLASSPKTYNITASGADSARLYLTAADKHTATGTVKIIGISDTYIQGTFTLTADGNTITNGIFNYKL